MTTTTQYLLYVLLFVFCFYFCIFISWTSTKRIFIPLVIDRNLELANISYYSFHYQLSVRVYQVAIVIDTPESTAMITCLFNTWGRQSWVGNVPAIHHTLPLSCGRRLYWVKDPLHGPLWGCMQRDDHEDVEIKLICGRPADSLNNRFSRGCPHRTNLLGRWTPVICADMELLVPVLTYFSLATMISIVSTMLTAHLHPELGSFTIIVAKTSVSGRYWVKSFSNFRDDDYRCKSPRVCDTKK
jgi:hypothetical protein